jgi:hypothetical protein
METPDLAARVNTQIRIEPDGRVSDASTSTGRAGTARLETCVAGTIRSWTFPPPAGGVAAVVPYTFVFQ